MRLLRRSAPPAPEPKPNSCRHLTEDGDPVHDVDGHLVASICTACDQSLPAWKTCEDCGWIEVATFGKHGAWRELMSPCKQHAQDGGRA